MSFVASRSRIWCAVAAVLVALPTQASTDTDQVRRLLSLLRGVEQEYQEAFDDSGKLVRPVEMEEAELLLAEARDRTQRLAGATAGELQQRLTALTEAVTTRAPSAVVVAQVRGIRTAVQISTGIGENMLPPESPSVSRGEGLFKANCVSCHGDHGSGDGPEVGKLKQRPPDFTDPTFMRQETPADIFLVITLGRRRSAMPAWGDVLTIQERWDLVSYIWSLHSDSNIEHELERVRQGVAAAVDAYRLRENDAADLATDAYLSFEPLEPMIARYDRSVVDRVEAEFVRLQRALHLPDAMKQVEEIGASTVSALEGAKRTVRQGHNDGAHPIGPAITIVSGTALLAVLYAVSRRRSRSRAEEKERDSVG